MLKRSFLIVLSVTVVLSGLPVVAFAQIDTLRIGTYSLLQFNSGSSATTSRLPHFRTVLAYMSPDLITVDEVGSSAALQLFRDSVLNAVFPGQYAMAPFHDGPDSDPGMCYRTSKFVYDSSRYFPTVLRDIVEYNLHTVVGNNRLRMYEAHLKASDGTAEALQRAGEAQILRDSLNRFPLGQDFIMTGDLNLYRATEAAFTLLLDSTANRQGRLIDPLAPGSLANGGVWHDGAAFAYLHTQSPRYAQFGGGASGGCDDRFDFLLYSEGMRDTVGIQYVPNSFVTIGQSGNFFNTLIDTTTNTSVPQTVARAIYWASDHLPVMAKFTTRPATPPTPPASPVLSITQIDAQNMRLSWQSVSRATSYSVFEADSIPNFWSTNFSSVWTGSDTSIVRSSSQPKRYYRVTARN